MKQFDRGELGAPDRVVQVEGEAHGVRVVGPQLPSPLGHRIAAGFLVVVEGAEGDQVVQEPTQWHRVHPAWGASSAAVDPSSFARSARRSVAATRRAIGANRSADSTTDVRCPSCAM